MPLNYSSESSCNTIKKKKTKKTINNRESTIYAELLYILKSQSLVSISYVIPTIIQPNKSLRRKFTDLLMDIHVRYKKDQKLKFEIYFLVNVYSFRSIVKSPKYK